MEIDLFIAAGELSGDLHGARLIEELLAQRPELKIGAVAGPRMRAFPIKEYFAMEKLQVMGFFDVFKALPKLIPYFYTLRRLLLDLAPKAVLFIDYPGLHLRLERSLRKKGFKGKIIHLVCPSVWAWRKGWIPKMAETLDLLLTFFPFEKKCFAQTKLNVEYIGHPLALAIAEFVPKGKFGKEKILALFPGSRPGEIRKNLPLQLKVARQMRALYPELKIAVSTAREGLLPTIPDALMVAPTDNYELMQSAHLALATSGTVTLELALHGTPTVVNYAIGAMDLFIAQKIFKIDLPFYCIANIVVQRAVFPELYGPHFTEKQLFFWAQKLWSDEEARALCQRGCLEVRKSLGLKRASSEGARAIISLLDF